MPFRVLEHTADARVEVSARDRKTLFADAARALFATIGELDRVRPREPVEIRLEAETPEELLVAWLSELLCRHETEGWLFSRFDIEELTERALRATAWGERLDPSRHVIDREVKAVTYHHLRIERTKDGYRVRIVFDL